MAIQSGQYGIVEQKASQSNAMMADFIGQSAMPIVATINKTNDDSLRLKTISDNTTLINQALTAAGEANPDRALQVFEHFITERQNTFSDLDETTRGLVLNDWNPRLAIARGTLIPKTAKRVATHNQNMYTLNFNNAANELQSAIADGDETAISNAMLAYHNRAATIKNEVISSDAWTSPAAAELWWSKANNDHVGNVTGMLIEQGTPHSLQEAQTLLNESDMYSGKPYHQSALRQAKTTLTNKMTSLQEGLYNSTINNQDGGLQAEMEEDAAFSMFDPADPISMRMANMNMPALYHSTIENFQGESVDDLDNYIKKQNRRYAQFNIDEKTARQAYTNRILNAEAKLRGEWYDVISPLAQEGNITKDTLDEQWEAFETPISVRNGMLVDSDKSTEMAKQRKMDFALDLIADQVLQDKNYKGGLEVIDAIGEFATSGGTYKNENWNTAFRAARNWETTKNTNAAVVKSKATQVISLATTSNNGVPMTPEEYDARVDSIINVLADPQFGAPEKEALDNQIAGQPSGEVRDNTLSVFRDAGYFSESVEQDEYDNLLSNAERSGDYTQFQAHLYKMREYGFSSELAGLAGDDKLMQIVVGKLGDGNEAEILGLLAIHKEGNAGNNLTAIDDFASIHKFVTESLEGNVLKDTKHKSFEYAKSLLGTGFWARHGINRQLTMNQDDRNAVTTAIALAVYNTGVDTYQNHEAMATIVSSQEFVDKVKNISDANTTPIPSMGLMSSRVINSFDPSEREVLQNNAVNASMMQPERDDYNWILGFLPVPNLGKLVAGGNEGEREQMFNEYGMSYSGVQSVANNTTQKTDWSGSIIQMRTMLGTDTYMEAEGSFVIEGQFDDSNVTFTEGEGSSSKYIVTPIYEGPAGTGNADLIGYQIMGFTRDSEGKATGLVPYELTSNDGTVLTPSGILSEHKLGISLSKTNNFTAVTEPLHALEAQLFTLGGLDYTNPKNRNAMQQTMDQQLAALYAGFQASGMGQTAQPVK